MRGDRVSCTGMWHRFASLAVHAVVGKRTGARKNGLTERLVPLWFSASCVKTMDVMVSGPSRVAAKLRRGAKASGCAGPEFQVRAITKLWHQLRSSTARDTRTSAFGSRVVTSPKLFATNLAITAQGGIVADPISAASHFTGVTMSEPVAIFLRPLRQPGGSGGWSIHEQPAFH